MFRVVKLVALLVFLQSLKLNAILARGVMVFSPTMAMAMMRSNLRGVGWAVNKALVIYAGVVK